MEHIAKALRDYLPTVDLSLKGLYDMWAESERVLISVIGDPILDRYVEINPRGMAKGYPVINWGQTGYKDYAGGCLKVAKDAAAQCTRVHLGLCGNGIPITYAMMALSDLPNIAFYGRGNPSCSLVEKIRYCYNNHQVFRLTIEHDKYGAYPTILDDAQVTILSIFDREEPICGKALLNLVGNSQLIVDSQNPKSIKAYRSDRTILFSTEDEFQASGCKMHEFKTIFLKNGIHGSLVNGYQIPAFNERPIDDIGAGDAYLAAASVMLGAHPEHYLQAGIIGSVAAALHCAEHGNITISREEIDNVLAQAAD